MKFCQLFRTCAYKVLYTRPPFSLRTGIEATTIVAKKVAKSSKSIINCCYMLRKQCNFAALFLQLHCTNSNVLAFCVGETQYPNLAIICYTRFCEVSITSQNSFILQMHKSKSKNSIENSIDRSSSLHFIIIDSYSTLYTHTNTLPYTSLCAFAHRDIKHALSGPHIRVLGQGVKIKCRGGGKPPTAKACTEGVCQIRGVAPRENLDIWIFEGLSIDSGAISALKLS